MELFKNRKMIVGGIVLTLALGAGGLSVYAAENGTQTTAPNAEVQQQTSAATKEDAEKGTGSWGDRHMRMMGEHGPHETLQTAADILGLKQEELLTELKAGKSLAEIAQAKGVSKETLISKLTEKASARLDEAVKAGKLTQEKADAIKQKLSEKSTKLVDIKGLPNFIHGKHHGMHHGKKHGFVMKESLTKVAKIIGITEKELLAEKKAGKSLAEIAAAHGISRDQLIAKLKEEMTPALEKFVDSKHEAKQDKK